ncbi:MAG: MBL fold metallo-hydrolase, partial [Paracoccaceae bacterium]
GTGFQNVKLDMERETFVLYSHFHHDHLQGLPFNASVFSHSEPIYLSSALVNRNVLRNMVQTYFSGGYFPVDIVNVLKQLKFMNVATIQRKLAPKIELDVIELNHPGGSMGYSIKTDTGKFTYLLDNEYLESQLESLLAFVKGSDLVIWDGMFTDEELVTKVGWGHSSIEQACTFAEEADIGHLSISHHNPPRTDAEFDSIAKTLSSSKVSFAIQGSEVRI